MEKEALSTKVRNYAIAGVCLVFAILIGGGLLWSVFAEREPNVWSECGGQVANVYIGAGSRLSNVRCVALDKEFFAKPEIVVGDMSKNDEDVCTFILSDNTTKPLRFEIWYDGKTRREVCNWQNLGGGID